MYILFCIFAIFLNLTCNSDDSDSPSYRPAPPDKAEEDCGQLEDPHHQVHQEGAQPVLQVAAGDEGRKGGSVALTSGNKRKCESSSSSYGSNNSTS